VNRLYGSAAGAMTTPSSNPALNVRGADSDLYLSPEESAKRTRAYYQDATKRFNDAYEKAAAAEKDGKLDDAQKFYYQALTTRERAWGETDPGVMTILLKLGELNIQQNHLDYAESCYKQYLKASSKNHGPGSQDEIPALKKLAEICHLHKQFDDESSYLRRVVDLQERNLGADSPEFRASRMSLIDASVKSADYQGAEELVKQAMKDVEPKGDKSSSETYINLLEAHAACLNGLNRSDDAKLIEVQVQALKQEREQAVKDAKSAVPSSPAAKSAEKPSDEPVAKVAGASKSPPVESAAEQRSKDLQTLESNKSGNQ
jgi:tetratricopeptide (TPR) repeat protein